MELAGSDSPHPEGGRTGAGGLAGFPVPTLLANVVGGGAMVALLNHGALAEELPD